MEVPNIDEMMESMVRSGEELQIKWRAMRAQWSRADMFCPISLGDWLQLCENAAIPTVPAIYIGSAAVDNLLELDPAAEGHDDVRRLYASIEAYDRTLGTGWMKRWDCCACADIKGALSGGAQEWQADFNRLPVDDFRAFDLIATFPRETISAWTRPWMVFDVHAGWPVEYRVFVQDDQIIGVSNYYPQRSLEDFAPAANDIDRCMGMTLELICAQKRPVLLGRENFFDEAANNWTADFARLPSGAILFLEGGPPHSPQGGAHPCCFRPGEIDGVALADRNSDERGRPDTDTEEL